MWVSEHPGTFFGVAIKKFLGLVKSFLTHFLLKNKYYTPIPNY